MLIISQRRRFVSGFVNAILVLDDESDIVFVFRKSLEKAGYTVFAFTDPLLALEHFKSNSDKYALIITDMRMPKMNGIEFLIQIRAINQSVKAIIMSAFDMQDLQIMPDLEIAECLQKPIKPDKLGEVVAKYIKVEHIDGNNSEAS